MSELVLTQLLFYMVAEHLLITGPKIQIKCFTDNKSPLLTDYIFFQNPLRKD